MNSAIVSCSEPITLAGGGPYKKAQLELCGTLSNRIVAVDGGANFCHSVGMLPDAVIGDLDSIDSAVRAAFPEDRIHQIAEQDTTDFDKALRSVSAPLILGVGFLGARMDHTLAAMNSLASHAHQRVLLLGEDDCIFHCPPAIKLDLAAGTRVSLFPMARLTGNSSGLHWPIDGLVFDPAGQTGTSNRATGPVSLTMEHPGMLVLLPKVLVRSAAQALLRAAAWPAPAGR